METKPIVKNYMTTNLIVLKDEMDVYFAIGLLLKNNISGAPVIDENNNPNSQLKERIEELVDVSISLSKKIA